MPITHTVLKSINILYMRFESNCAIVEIQKACHKASVDADFDQNLCQFVDLRSGSIGQLTTSDLSILGTTTIFNYGVRRAFVVSNELNFGLLKMFKAFSEHHNQQIHIFRSVEEACEWLNIPVSALPEP